VTRDTARLHRWLRARAGGLFADDDSWGSLRREQRTETEDIPGRFAQTFEGEIEGDQDRVMIGIGRSPSQQADASSRKNRRYSGGDDAISAM